MTAMSSLGGWNLIPTSALPMKPTTGEWARRLVRHGLEDVLLWLGEDVGPTPDAETHLLVTNSLGASSGPAAFVSHELAERIKRQGRMT